MVEVEKNTLYYELKGYELEAGLYFHNSIYCWIYFRRNGYRANN